MDIYTFLSMNFAPIAGIAFLLIFLNFNALLDVRIKKLFFLLLMLEAAELVVYNVELLFAMQSTFSVWRILLSVIGYGIRPVLCFIGLLLVMRRHLSKKERAFLLLPLCVNLLIVFSAFWTDIAFSYTAANQFVRGPLGYSSHICVCLYLLILIWMTISQLCKRNQLESIIMIAVSILLMGSMLAEAIWSVRSIGRTAIVLSTMICYMFFQTKEYQVTLAEEERINEELAQQARTDQLTGLLNKAAFLSELDSAMESPVDSSRALIFFDLDHFKDINDSLGHQAGDQALAEVAHSMRRVFGKEDVLGRFGGDEFCVLLRGASMERLTQKLDELSRALRRTYTQGKHEVAVTGSIGAALTGPYSEADSASMMKTADAATYMVKKNRQGSYKIITL